MQLSNQRVNKIIILLYLKHGYTISLYIPICKQNAYIFHFHIKTVVILFCFKGEKGQNRAWQTVFFYSEHPNQAIKGNPDLTSK